MKFILLLLLLLLLLFSTALSARDLGGVATAKPSSKIADAGAATPRLGSIPGGGYFGPGDGFGNPGFDGNGWGNLGGGYGAGYGGPGGGYARGGVVRSSMLCTDHGPCYKKRVTCPAKCFSFYSRTGKNYGGGGGGGGCTIDCKKHCVAYC